MSGLYFRGKITYARKFGRAFVITPDQGLIPAETTITSQVLIRFADAEIDLGNPGYRTPLEQTARALADEAGARCAVRAARQRRVGEICPGAERRFSVRGSSFRRTFVGRGDMSRGGLLLRAAAASAGARLHPRHRRRAPWGSSAEARPAQPARDPFFTRNSHTLMCGSISGGGVCSIVVGFGGFIVQIGAIALLTRHFGWPPSPQPPWRSSLRRSRTSWRTAAGRGAIGLSEAASRGLRQPAGWLRRYWRYQACETASLAANLAMTALLITPACRRSSRTPSPSSSAPFLTILISEHLVFRHTS